MILRMCLKSTCRASIAPGLVMSLFRHRRSLPGPNGAHVALFQRSGMNGLPVLWGSGSGERSDQML